jgi:hypothetical protein
MLCSTKSMKTTNKPKYIQIKLAEQEFANLMKDYQITVPIKHIAATQQPESIKVYQDKGFNNNPFTQLCQ